MYDTLILILEVIGTVAFALSGAMIGVKRKLDILGVIILGCITACGGGLLRDTMLGIIPQNLFLNPLYVILALITSLILFIILYIIKDDSITEYKWYKDLLVITDAIGLATFVIVGANITINQMGIEGNGFLIIFMSFLTACGGGMLRDIFAGQIPAIFRKHIYALPTIVGAIIYYFLLKFNLNVYINIIIVSLFIIIIRLLAYKFKWSLPIVELKNHNENLWYFFFKL